MRDGIVDAVRDFRADAERARGADHRRRATRSARAWTSARRPSRRPASPGFTTRSTSEALRVGVQAFIRELWELDKPTVAAVNGAAVGPGRAPRARVRLRARARAARASCGRSPKWGLVVDAGGAYLLPRLVGLPRAKAMVMLGEGVTRRGGGRRSASRTGASTTPDELVAEAERARRAARARARRGRSACRSGCSTRRSRPTSPTRSSSRATSSRSRPRRPTSSRAWPRSREKRDARFTAREPRPLRGPARRGVRRLHRRRRPAAAVPAHRDIDGTRRGAWTLPGGGIEFGEHPEAAALRELHEETGTRRPPRRTARASTPPRARARRRRACTVRPCTAIRIVYRAEVDGRRAAVTRWTARADSAQWFTRAETQDLDLVDVAVLGSRYVWR